MFFSVFCSKTVPQSSISSDRPSLLPPTITELLSTQQQTDWWLAMHKMYTNQPSNNNSEMRMRLKKGIETVRAAGILRAIFNKKKLTLILKMCVKLVGSQTITSANIEQLLTLI